MYSDYRKRNNKVKQLSAQLRQFSKAQIYNNFSTLLQHGKWAIKLTWVTDRKLLLGLIAANAVQSIYFDPCR